MQSNKFEMGLEKRQANYVPLSPTSLIRRTAKAYPQAPAILFDDLELNWRELFHRCSKLAGALRDAGAAPSTTVAAFCRNVPAAVELSHAVPMSRAVLNMVNTRLDAAALAFILEHGEADFLFVDAALVDIATHALGLTKRHLTVVFIPDTVIDESKPADWVDYEAFMSGASALGDDDLLPADEWDAIALNYTSGTTGDPKGVVYHHRGAYLNALGNALEWSMPTHPRYLWTLPLFHCNGWCFPWTLAVKAGVNICLRAPVASDIVDTLEAHGVTHLCGAPIVLNMAITELERRNQVLAAPVAAMTAGAAPPSQLLQRAEAVGFDVTHVYGLTEVYGPTAVCAWRTEWDALPAKDRAQKKARQGVNYAVLEDLDVHPPTGGPQHDTASQLGEIVFRGNVVMKGYLKNQKATEEAFMDGYFHSGDLAVRHPDDHIEIKDRSKDIIISGGENISSIEVESVLYQHAAVLECAVVARPHEKWGETPVAFVELREGMERGVDEQALIEFCRERLAHFKCPTAIEFQALPKTATGKIQKYALRGKLRSTK